MPHKPIPPVPGRRWPPEHCWMDENGAWWEAPGKRLELGSSDSVVVGNIFIADNQDYAISVGAEITSKGFTVKERAMSDWQPIETAPKDGTIILLGGGTWGDDGLPEAKRVMAARWYHGNRGRSFWNVCEAEGGYSCFPYKDPTHWMPLPEPPRPNP